MDQKLLPFAVQDVPRYTSYPTAVQFRSDFAPELADQWLRELSPETSLSVYVHIPFCRQLCWYCGCHTSVPNSYDRAARYVDLLVQDIRRTARLVGGKRGRVKHVHLGGGTPTYLDDFHIGEILEAVDKGLGLATDAEVALESDPRTLTAARAKALAFMGFTRVSFGVQDFATPVQMKINRLQTFGLVAAATDYLRQAGFTSINFDLMYGLPGQTEASVARTAQQAATLAPERLAVFGYAHVPWFKKHQKMISDADLPGVAERYAQARTIEAELGAAGYAAVGLDHFALPHDPLTVAAASGKLRRNFQGYTTDISDALLAFGASAIAETPQGFMQAARDTLQWSERVAAGANPVARGLMLTSEDRLRAAVIERLMCDFAVDYGALAAAHGFGADHFSEVPGKLAPAIAAGLASLEGTRVSVPPHHRLFLRSVAAAFDAHFTMAPNRHARAV
ncbi:MAG: oxygen-independent coproporphyrinogen III oxidase [Rhizobiales bacterium]|nr:oxygen-independent coproporphyrinogen III oxidase [Hyphomicrobiales bacterium]MBI3674591.1 oxygen-independent coproporphyrinogen III oxidase [Hyphomicrobiales bacterium]